MKRTVVKGVRLGRTELAALKRAAKLEGTGLATWMRRRLLAGLVVHGEEAEDVRQLPLPGA